MYSVGPGPTCVAAEWSWADQIRNARIRAWAGAVAPRAPETHKVTRGRNATEFTGRHQHSWASDDHHGQSNNGGIGDGGSGGPQLDHRRRAGRPCHQPGNSIARRRVDTAGTRMERPIAVANAEFCYRLREWPSSAGGAQTRRVTRGRSLTTAANMSGSIQPAIFIASVFKRNHPLLHAERTGTPLARGDAATLDAARLGKGSMRADARDE